MDIALYVRVSTNHQQQTQTIEQQIERLQAHVAGHPDWHLSEEHIYRDDGYSGAKLDRPGLDRLRDHAALADFEQVLITAPDRLARNYVHQVLLIDELTKVGCQVSFLERPMSDDPHDQLLLQIRGAVAEYERTLIADRMRRGRQAKMRSGRLLPWTVPPYGYLLDPERPRDPSRVRLDVVKGEVVKQIFEWYTDPVQSGTLYAIAKQLSDTQVPTPAGGRCWSVSSVRSILRNSSYAGIAYSGRSRPAAARHRKSALLPVGPGFSHTSTPPEEWIPIQVPALVSQETFDAVQARLDWNKQMARRNNDTHEYLLRGLVSCAQCRLACPARTLPSGYSYYVCRGHTDVLRAVEGKRCTARYAPAQGLDDLVWQDMCCLLAQPALIIHELEHGQGGAWLPQALQDRRRTLRAALAQLERQQARLLEVYLAEIIKRDEFERKRQELMHTQTGLSQQLRQLEAQAQKQIEVTGLAAGITAFCQRLQPTLDHLTFAQRRKLVELLIDRVIVDDDTVEIRYVIPTSPEGEESPFCHLRLDHFDRLPPVVAVKPADEITQDVAVTIVQERAVLLCLSCLEPLQGDIQRVRTTTNWHALAAGHDRIGPNGCPVHVCCHLLFEPQRDGATAWLGVDVIPHLNRQGNVIACPEASVEATLCPNRVDIGRIVVLKADQALTQEGILGA
jgi:site-specific DNA recombinase